MAEIENKFIVINKKFLHQMPQVDRIRFQSALISIEKYLPDNKYYVCNQDEPYAQEVINIILKGEDAKDDVVDAEFEPEID
jgi:hypothetical protein